MLLEPTDHPNFPVIFESLYYILVYAEVCSAYKESLENPDCNMSKYIKNFLIFYEINKEKIKENIRKNPHNQKPYEDKETIETANIFDCFEKKTCGGLLDKEIEL